MLDDLPYQRGGANWLATNKRAGLADEQGLGKTVQAIMAADEIGAQRIVVVSPAKMRATWLHEFQTKAKPFAARKLRILSYEEASKIFPKVDNPKLDLVILDEAHYLKNPDAIRTRAIYPRTWNVPHVWALTGTPMPNNPTELYTHFKFLRPELLTASMDGPMSFEQFRAHFCVLRKGFGNQPRVVGVKNAGQLRDLNRKLWLRRTLVDVQAQLPPMRYGEIIIDTPQKGEALRQINRGVQDLDREKLTRLTIDPTTLPFGDEHLSSLRAAIASAKALPLAEYLYEELANSPPSHKIVLFWWHTEAISISANILADFNPVIIDGRTSDVQVQQRVRKFQTDPDTRVLIGQIRAAGTGLTLTASNSVVFGELSWTLADNSQAERRILRIGQKASSVLCRHAILSGSVDEAVTRVLAHKSRMIQSIMEPHT